MASSWHSGNAYDEGQERRGWILGHFVNPSEDIRSSSDLEVKWGVHTRNEQRTTWVTGEERTTLVLLVSGHFCIDLGQGDIALEKQGDYLMWGPGTDHIWRAEEDSVVITVRWPSLAS